MTGGASPVEAARALPAWDDLPAVPVLRPQEVHIWRAFLDDRAWSLERFADILSTDERRRAGRFSFAPDRRRFVVRRGVLRLLVAGYLDRAPDTVEFRGGPHGKPEVAVAAGDPPVQFNGSHSRGLALYAFTRGRRVGVDVEALRPLPDASGIATLCFSPRERAELAALSSDRRDEAVLRAWTVKEAYAKAVGEGLTTALDGVEVSVASADPPALRAIDGDSRRARNWSLRVFSPHAGYVAALVVGACHGDGLQPPRYLAVDPA